MKLKNAGKAVMITLEIFVARFLGVALGSGLIFAACQDDSDKNLRSANLQPQSQEESANSIAANSSQVGSQSSLALSGDEICPAGFYVSDKSFSVDNYCQFGAATSAHMGKADSSDPFVFLVTKEVLSGGGIKFVTTCYANITCEFQGASAGNYCDANFKPGSIDALLDPSAKDCKKNLETVDRIFTHEFRTLDANKEATERDACLGVGSYDALRFCHNNNKTIPDSSELIKCCQQGPKPQKVPVAVEVIGMGNVTDDSDPEKINCPDKSRCSAQYLPGNDVKFSASSRIGFRFQRWERDGQEVCSGKTSCTISTTLQPGQSTIALKAIFDGKITDAVHLAVDVQGFKNGTVKDQLGLINCRLVNGSRDMTDSKCNATYNRDQNVKLTALGEDNETKFDKWLQGLGAPVSGATLELKLTEDKTVIAYFKLSDTADNDPNPYSLTVKVKGRGKVVDDRNKINCINNSYGPNDVVECSASYPRQVANIPETVTLTATPQSASSFVRWEGNYTSARTTETSSIAKIDLATDEVITAIFNGEGGDSGGDPSPDPNPSATPTPSASVSPSASASASQSSTPTLTPTITPSPTIAPSGYPTAMPPATSTAPVWSSMPVLKVPTQMPTPAQSSLVMTPDGSISPVAGAISPSPSSTSPSSTGSGGVTWYPY